MTEARTALVTGATGFIGRSLVTQLVARGFEVTCLLRKTSKVPDFPPAAADAFSRVHIIRLSGDGDLEQLPHTDAIFHLAAAGVDPGERDAALLTAANVDFPGKVIAHAARTGARVILAGSCAEYAPLEAPGRLDETSPIQRTNLYGATKALGTERALEQASRLGVPAVCCRLFNVYGAGEPAHRLFASAVEKLSRGQRLPLSAGRQVRDFISVTDACAGLLAAEGWLSRQDGATGNGIMNLCTGEGRSVRDLAYDIARVLGAEPELLGIGDLPLRPDDFPFVVGDPGRMTALAGWTASPYPAALAGEIAVLTEALPRGR